MPLSQFHELLKIIGPFEGILLDAYGVFWGGNEAGMLPGSQEAMQKMVSLGKVVGVLSNSTQSAAQEREKLLKHGLVEGTHFHFFVTSGEISRQAFCHGQLSFSTPKNKYWLLGEPHPKFSSPHSHFERSPYTEAKKIEEADFIFIAIPHIEGQDQTDKELFRKNVKKAFSSKLPMVCTNPDHYAHEGNPPQLVVRQGSIAAMYEEEGGEVFYIGKPGQIAYASAMEHFSLRGITQPQQVLMIGDTPETDIRGAKSFGMASALILNTGIMAEKIKKNGLEKSLSALPLKDQPTYLLERLAL